MSTSSRYSKAADLLRRVEREPRNGPLVTELLDEFFLGYPVENLVKLIHSDDEGIVRVGVWLASELGAKCHPILREVSALFDHPSEYVRFFAIDCVLSASNTSDGDLVAAVTRFLRDPSPAVRSKAIDFFARIRIEKLSVVLDASESSKLCTDDVEGIQLILSSKTSVEKIRQFIESDDPIQRKYGVAAAARVYSVQQDLLHVALVSNDDDLAKFADDVIAQSRIRRS